jgi:hypothetical protein
MDQSLTNRRTNENYFLTIPESVSHYFGEVCFLERSDPNGCKVYLPGIIVGPYDIPFDHLRSLCVTHYSNVRELRFYLPFLFSNQYSMLRIIVL